MWLCLQGEASAPTEKVHSNDLPEGTPLFKTENKPGTPDVPFIVVNTLIFKEVSCPQQSQGREANITLYTAVMRPSNQNFIKIPR